MKLSNMECFLSQHIKEPESMVYWSLSLDNQKGWFIDRSV